MGTVNYNGKTVSDENVKKVLKNVATQLDVDVTVTSGDRTAVVKGSSKKSHHIQKRAADFYTSKLTLSKAFKKMQEKKDKIFDSDKHYQVIHHGSHTDTGGSHLHVGRYASGKGVKFYEEGMTKDGKGKYTLASGINYVPTIEQEQERSRMLAHWSTIDDEVICG